MHTHYQNLVLLSISLLAVSIILSASSCNKEDQLANQIERNTPTELPAITQTGANSMGAYVTIGEERHLFVASGVDRNETTGASSLDCKPFDNYLYRRTDNIVISGIWCSRPEIDRPIQMDLAVMRNLSSDSIRLSFGIDYDGLSSGGRTIYNSNGRQQEITITTSRLDTTNKIFSGIFSGILINYENPLDTAFITDGRFDVRYGMTQ